MSKIQDLKYKFKKLDAFGKIIVINAIVFIIFLLLDSLFGLGYIQNYFAFPSSFGSFLVKPWSIITYGFLHVDIFHLLFNMLFLFYLSRITVNLFRPKMSLNIYFLGIICGAILFITVANILPSSFLSFNGLLYGASAGVCALLAFVATYMPDSEIRPFNLFNIKWKHVALIFIGFDILRMLSGQNRGGYIAHIGGYLLGFYYAKSLMNGKDIGKGFEKLMDSFANLFTPKSNLKTVHRKKRTTSSSKKTKDEFQTFNKQKQIDIILDKISKSGYDSLTAKEKEFLFRSGK